MERGIVVAFTSRCPAGAAGDGLRVPRRWRHVGARRRAARGPPHRPEGADRARGRPRRRVWIARPSPSCSRTRPAGDPCVGCAPRDRPRGMAAIDLMPLDTLVTGRIATFAGAVRLRLGRGDRDPRRQGRLRRFGDRARDARRPAHPPDRARAGRDRDARDHRRAHPSRRARRWPSTQVDLSTAPTLDEPRWTSSRRGATDRGAGLDPRRRLGPAPLGRVADRRRPRARRARTPGRPPRRSTTTRSGRATLRSPPPGSTASTPDPAGGVIRRGADGAPDGVLLENAGGPRHRPRPAARGRGHPAGAQSRSAGSCSRLGVVGAHEPALPRRRSDEPSPRPVRRHGRGRRAAAFRVRAGVQDDGLENAIERGLRSGAAIGGSDPAWLSMGWLKLFADGTLGSRTAALLEPLEGGGGTGHLHDAARASSPSLAARAAAAGHRDHDPRHRRRGGPGGPRRPRADRRRRRRSCPGWSTSSCAIPTTGRRFAALGIAASVQPVHLREDAATARRDWGARAESSGYAWRSLLDAGASLAFGTDAPVEPIDPWPGIALAVLRRDPSWGPDVAAFGPRRGPHARAVAPRRDRRRRRGREGPARRPARPGLARGPDRAAGGAARVRRRRRAGRRLGRGPAAPDRCSAARSSSSASPARSASSALASAAAWVRASAVARRAGRRTTARWRRSSRSRACSGDRRMPATPDRGRRRW